MRQFLIIISIIFIGQICSAQITNGSENIKSTESFNNIKDTLIRKEIALFTIKGFSDNKPDSLNKPELIEIPLIRCTDSSAYFEKGNLYESEIIVNIASENRNSESRIKEVIYMHFKYGLMLPDSAISGLYNPDFCSKKRGSKNAITSNCKVFRSEDKRRVYIYMLNGDANSRYEVTWVIKDGEYFTRIIDKVN